MKTRLRLDALESRVTPAATFIHYGVGIVGGEQQLAYFASDLPLRTIDTIDVTGMPANQDLVAIDVRPADGLLYGLTINGNTGRIYTIDPATGAAAQVGGSFNAVGVEFGLDFDPVTGLAHLVSDADRHIVFDPETGTSQELPLLAAGLTMVAAAFSADALYGIDTAGNEVVRIDAATSALTPVGPLGFDATAAVGFDIAPNGQAYASFESAGGASLLYSLSLADGTPTLVGTLDASIDVIDVALLGTVTLPDKRTATYEDADGDAVTLKVDKGRLTSTALGLKPAVGGGLRLDELNLQDPSYAGTSVKTSAVAGPAGGDGFVHIPLILGGRNNLAAVIVDGDLGRIDAGDPTDGFGRAAVKSLTVQSMGMFDPDASSSLLRGAIKKLTVKGDVRGTRIVASGRIGEAKITGSLIGDDDAGSATIVAPGFGSIFIVGDVLGGAGNQSAAILSRGTRVFIGGDVRGTTPGSATIDSAQFVTINGNVTGGTGLDSGVITGKNVFIGADLRGGVGLGSGRVDIDAGAVTLGGSVVGGPAAGSGTVNVAGTGGAKSRVTIGGSIVGGGDDAGFVEVLDGAALSYLKIAGIIVGGGGVRSGLVRTAAGADIDLLTVGGDIRGGSADDTGGIIAGGDIGELLVGGGFFGSAPGSGLISVAGSVGTLTFGGSVLGWTVDNTSVVDVAGDIGTLVIGDSIEDIGGTNSGIVRAGGSIGQASIKYDIVGFAAGSSQLISGGDMGTVTLGGSLIGGPGDFSSRLLSGGNIGSLTIGRDVRAGDGLLSGSVAAAGRIDGMRVEGSLIGTSGARVRILAGATAGDDPAIGQLTVHGRVEFAQVLAGYNANGSFINGDAAIGTVIVDHDWIASDLVAGGLANNNRFGDDDDTVPGDASRIDSILIRGQALGTVGGADHFGFVAREVGSMSVGGALIPLTAGTDVISVGVTGDLKVREVA